LQYSKQYTKKVRDGIENVLELSLAVAEAVKYCEDNNILKNFLMKHASEMGGKGDDERIN